MGIKEIRNISSNLFINEEIQKCTQIDHSFYQWLSGLRPDDSPDDRILSEKYPENDRASPSKPIG